MHDGDTVAVVVTICVRTHALQHEKAHASHVTRLRIFRLNGSTQISQHIASDLGKVAATLFAFLVSIFFFDTTHTHTLSLL